MSVVSQVDSMQRGDGLASLEIRGLEYQRRPGPEPSVTAFEVAQIGGVVRS